MVAEFEDDVLLMLKFAKIPTKSVEMNKSAKSLKRQIEEYAKGNFTLHISVLRSYFRNNRIKPDQLQITANENLIFNLRCGII